MNKNSNIIKRLKYDYTLSEAEQIVKKGFKSSIAQNKECEAEGLILKTSLGLNDRGGKRIITKIKRLIIVI